MIPKEQKLLKSLNFIQKRRRVSRRKPNSTKQLYRQCQSLKGLEANKAKARSPKRWLSSFQNLWISGLWSRVVLWGGKTPYSPLQTWFTLLAIDNLHKKTPTTLTFGARKNIVRKSRAFVCPDCRLLYSFFHLPKRMNELYLPFTSLFLELQYLLVIHL